MDYEQAILSLCGFRGGRNAGPNYAGASEFSRLHFGPPDEILLDIIFGVRYKYSTRYTVTYSVNFMELPCGPGGIVVW